MAGIANVVRLCLALALLCWQAWASVVGDNCTADNSLCNSAGHYCSSNACAEVPAGSYSTADTGVAVQCAAGYTTASTTSTAVTACDVCADIGGVKRFSSTGNGDGSGNTGCAVCDTNAHLCTGGSTAGTCNAGFYGHAASTGTTASSALSALAAEDISGGALVTTADILLNNLSGASSGLTPGTFTGIPLTPAASSGGSGVGGIVTVTVNTSGAVSAVTVTTAGSGYAENDMLVIKWGCTACVNGTK